MKELELKEDEFTKTVNEYEGIIAEMDADFKKVQSEMAEM